MRVEEAMSFQEYWEDPQFLRKRPDMKSTWDRACGDNIYYRDPNDSEFRQVPSYHCCPDGTSNRDMLVHDTKVDRVLVGADFIYWGGDGPPIPDFRGVRIAHTGVGHRSKFSDPVVREFVNWIRSFDADGRCGVPLDLRRSPCDLPDGRAAEYG